MEFNYFIVISGCFYYLFSIDEKIFMVVFLNKKREFFVVVIKFFR